MKQLAVVIGMSFLTPIFGAGGIEESEKMKTIFQCGVGTENGFNGWKINGLSDEANTYYEKNHLEFFQHNPGNYSVAFEKKIDEMVGYTNLRLDVDIVAVENCMINYATAYFSVDGKHWTAVNKDARNGAELRSEKMENSFLKIVVDLTFFQEARFRLNRARIFGAYKPTKPKPVSAESTISKNFDGFQIFEEFNIFSFDKKINVETQNDEEYEFVLSNVLGQIVIQEKSQGSTRFETDLPKGIYFVTIVQGDKRITTKKVVL